MRCPLCGRLRNASFEPFCESLFVIRIARAWPARDLRAICRAPSGQASPNQAAPNHKVPQHHLNSASTPSQHEAAAPADNNRLHPTANCNRSAQRLVSPTFVAELPLQRYSRTTTLRSEPMPSICTTGSSPASRWPEASGVPVMMTSPGSSVVKLEMAAICSGMP